MQVEEPLHDDVRRGQRHHGNRVRALAFRVRPAGMSAEEALRKVLASILQRTAA